MHVLKLLDVVALTEDIPDRGLRRGQAGTIVEMSGSDVFEVEFSDGMGRAYATASLRAAQVMRLQFETTK
ncbi:MAG: DUF4926 domain-containing protein [Nitrospira sp.]|nr:DUF4926 domain-containing protein [Nitrospira sp.]